MDAGTGQDADLRTSFPWPEPRTSFELVQIRDRATGLLWHRRANCLGHSYPGLDVEGTPGDGLVSWQTALDFVAGVNDSTYGLCSLGYDDWRMPSIAELASLLHAVDITVRDWLLGAFFQGPEHLVWSSTSNAAFPEVAWAIDWDAEQILGMAKGGGTPGLASTMMVRDAVEEPGVEYHQPLASGQVACWNSNGDPVSCSATGQDGEGRYGHDWVPDLRFLDNGDGTFRDLATGLVWMGDADCVSTSGFDPDGEISWYEAFDFATAVNEVWAGITLCDESGAGDWRLPNVVELRSLYNFGQGDPSGWLEGAGFNGVAIDGYWSSTTNDGPGHTPADVGSAFTVAFAPLAFVQRPEPKLEERPVWLVRGRWCLFCDGFETGDTAQWSATTP